MITNLTGIQLNDIRAVIFDLDGTLAHSNPDFSGLRQELGIQSDEDILSYINGLLSVSAKKSAFDIVHRYELISSQNATWIEGASDLIAFLKMQQLPVAILTRNMPAAAQVTMDKLGIDIPLVLTRDDAEPKPSPEGIHLICQQWQLSPKNILYVGDYIFDLQTAQNAGSYCALYCPSSVPEYAYGADLIVSCYKSLIHDWQQALVS